MRHRPLNPSAVTSRGDRVAGQPIPPFNPLNSDPDRRVEEPVQGSQARPRDAERLALATVSPPRGERRAPIRRLFHKVVLSGGGMAQTMNKEARRTTVRTYEGVQWFKDGPHWRCSVPGTDLSVVRWHDRPHCTGWFLGVEVWEDNGLGGYWQPVVRDHRTGACEDIPWRLPWSQLHTSSVGAASNHVKVLRNQINMQLERGVGA